MHDLPLISTIAAAFAVAWVLGLFCQWVRLSPIVGYLVAGVLIGPNTPGFVGNLDLAHELAEIGVILLMFGVGLHFHPKDLLAVKGIAIPGAIGQSLAATLAAAGIFTLFGISLTESIVIGMAMAVASTVVLMRVLISAGVLNSPQGHAAVGWLIVEDILTVVLLVLIPILGTSALQPGTGGTAAPAPGGASGAGGAALQIGLALLKLGVFVGLMMLAGHKLVPWMLIRIARLRSRELFTLTVLVLSIAVAAGAYFAFGASMALGAFLAGMMVAQSPVSHQAAADALPLRDAFAVLFFVSVGMLFDPSFLVQEPWMVLAGLGVVLLVKPLAALVIVALLGHPVRTGLTIAFGLAQIGEFSFIVAELARRNGIMPAEGQNVIIAAAIVSITINPILFRAIGPLEKLIARSPLLRRLLDGRAERRLKQLSPLPPAATNADGQPKRSAIIVGHGPVGRTVEQLLRERGFETVIIDMNADTVLELQRQGRRAIYGDATNSEVLEQAGVERASHLIITLPEAPDRAAAVASARHANENIRILVRARFLREQDALTQVGANAAIFDESEAAVALARLVLNETGTTDGAEIDRDAQRLRRQFPRSVQF